MYTTLNKIRACSPCEDGWVKLLKYLGKTCGDDELLSIETIIDSNGLNDALWCLKCVDDKPKDIRLFPIFCIKRVEHLIQNKKSIKCLDVTEKYINGLETIKELNSAMAAELDELLSEQDELTTDWGRLGEFAARSAVRHAARASAWNSRVEWDVRSNWYEWTPDFAERHAVCAVGYAAWDAAMAAKLAAEPDKRDEVWATEIVAQEKELRRICKIGQCVEFF
jgi:hypothetical protein